MQYTIITKSCQVIVYSCEAYYELNTVLPSHFWFLSTYLSEQIKSTV